jgi:hypothetical protein
VSCIDDRYGDEHLVELCGELPATEPEPAGRTTHDVIRDLADYQSTT